MTADVYGILTSTRRVKGMFVSSDRRDPILETSSLVRLIVRSSAATASLRKFAKRF